MAVDERTSKRGVSRKWLHTMIGVSAAVVVPVVVAVAVAAPKVFTSGTAISSADVNANFDGMEKRLAALEAAAAAGASTAALTGVDQRVAKLETSLAVGGWTAVPIATNAPIDAWPDTKFGTGIAYKNIGPLTCLNGLIRLNVANFTSTVAVLPIGARPPKWMVLNAAWLTTSAPLAKCDQAFVCVNG